MSWRTFVFDWLYWGYQIFGSVREYFSASTLNARDALENDGGADDQIYRIAMTNENDNADTISEGTRPVFNIHLPSNTGTVVIGDNSTVNCVKNVGTVSGEREKNEQTTSLAVSNLNEVKEEPLMVNDDKRKRRRKRKNGEVDKKPSKMSSVGRRINEIEKELSKYRENGEWLNHNKAIERLFDTYKRDDDNSDIILLLKYEKAAASCEKNEIETSLKLIAGLGKEMNATEKPNWERANDIQKTIFCKCLFLASKLYCIKRTFGKAEKTLKTASRLLSDYNNVELKAQLYLSNAYYQLCLNQSYCKLEGANHVIEYTKKAEQICTTLKDQFQEKRERIRRKILLIRCKAIIQFYLDNEDTDVFSTMLSNSLEELENHLWNGISPRQKVDFHMLKSNHFKLHRNVAKALDHAKDALLIAQECQFTKKAKEIDDHICKLTAVFREDLVTDSERLVEKVLAIETTTDGNAESNAAGMTDRGIFSTDESEWESLVSLLGQPGHRQGIEDDEEENDVL